MISAYDTIAEVAVAVVGFVAIVASINRDRVSTDLERVFIRIRKIKGMFGIAMQYVDSIK